MPSDKPILSVLIPSIPERYGAAGQLLTQLQHQAAMAGFGGRVEVLILTDNRARSIGLKRQALLEASRGFYVAFVDDDDQVLPEYVNRIAQGASCDWEEPPEVLVFDHWVDYWHNADPLGPKTRCRVNVQLAHPNEELKLDGVTRRKPWHTCAWRRDVAMASRYPDLNWGEDAEYLRPLWDSASSMRELRVFDEPLYVYTIRPGNSRASLEKP